MDALFPTSEGKRQERTHVTLEDAIMWSRFRAFPKSCCSHLVSSVLAPGTSYTQKGMKQIRAPAHASNRIKGPKPNGLTRANDTARKNQ